MNLPIVLGVLVPLLAVLALATAGATETELLTNPRFRQPDAQGLPAGWQLWQPGHEPAMATIHATPQGLLCTAPGKPFAVGGATQDVAGIQGGQAYAFRVRTTMTDVTHPYQTAHVRVFWLKGGQPVHPAGSLVRGPAMKGSEGLFEDILIAPPEADSAQLLLEFRWSQGGSVLWKSVSMTPSAPPPARKVKIGTVYLRPQSSTPEQNLDLWCAQVDAAGKLGLDIVCLSEAILLPGTDKHAWDIAEPIPGPTTRRLGEVAKRNHLYVVAGLMEQQGKALFNTAVLMDRDGQLAGTYRKTHLPREEWRQGVTPGHDYPVFRTDFGTIAIQICYDWFFPEVAAAFALRGAEIIFAPTWGTTFADEDGRAEGETTFRVRARDNGVYMVPSVYDGSSMVIDPMGRILASNKGQTGVFWAEVDLSVREPSWWVGYWRAIGPRDRMPYTYEPLTEPMRKPNY